jgi:hypothetical protein
VTQSTIQNCFVKCGHVKKNQEGSDMMEVNGSGEDVMQDEHRFDWGQAPLAWTLKLPTCGVLCMEEMWCGGKRKLRGGGAR